MNLFPIPSRPACFRSSHLSGPLPLLPASFALAFVLAIAPAPSDAEILAGLEGYGDLTLVDEIDCATDTEHEFRDYPSGASSVQTVLGSPCRVIDHPEGHSGFFAYRLGKGKGLEPHAMYLLVAEYPEDAPRTVTLVNKGQNSRNGFYTGAAVGISLETVLAQVRPESVGVPLSGDWSRLEQTMILDEKVYPLELPPDKSEKESLLEDSVANGFYVAFQVFKKSAAPDSAGAAIRAIRLYRMNDEAGRAVAPRYPAGDAPRRLVTAREEMGNEHWRIANADSLDGIRHKARMLRAMGLNCFSRTMLEFGFNKNWDAAYSNELGAAWWHNGWTAESNWSLSGGVNDLWSEEVDVYGTEGLYLLPYYEYSGGRGPNGLGVSTWRKAVPLFSDTGINSDTHQNMFVKASNGASKANVDLTQDAAYDDFERVLACTILRYKDRAAFAGAWIRNRGSMPVSFSNMALASFCKDTGRAAGSVTRQSILDSIGGDATNQKWINLSQHGTNRWSSLYSEYRAWWYGKRADWLAAMQNYLEEDGGLANAKVFFTTTPGEAGPTMHEPTGNSYDYQSGRANALARLNSDATISGRGAYNIPYMAQGYNEIGLFVDGWNYWPYEYNHAEPAHDPLTYHGRTGVALTYPYDTVYSAVAGGPNFKAPSFRNASGDLFFARFLNLHEGCGKNASGKEATGYFTCEMDHAGRAIMLPELWGVLYQDPTVIGFLQGNQFARNFSAPFREFAENFLSLPAQPGSFVQGSNWWGSSFGVRRYDAAGEKYFAVVNASADAMPGSEISVGDASISTLYETVGGRAVPVSGGKFTADIAPYQLKCYSTVAPDTPAFLVGVSEIGEETARIPLDVSTLGGDAANLSVAYSASPDMTGAVALPVASLSAVGTNWVELANLAPGTAYYATFGLTNSLSKGAAHVLSFTTASPPDPADTLFVGDTRVVMTADGAVATISATVLRANASDATVELLVNGAVAHTWHDVVEGQLLSFDVPSKVGRTDEFSFRIQSETAGIFTETSGRWTGRKFVDWFTVEFSAQGYPEGTGWRDVPAECGAWSSSPDATSSLAASDGGASIVTYAFPEGSAGSISYRPVAPSKSGAGVRIEGKSAFIVGTLPTPNPDAICGLAAASDADGAPAFFGLAAGHWQRLSGVTPSGNGTLREWAVDLALDEAPPTATYHVDGVALSPALPVDSGVSSVSRIAWYGKGAFSDFTGVIRSYEPDAPTYYAVEVSPASGALSFNSPGLETETFSVSVAEPAAGLWYTAFAARSLDGPFVAAVSEQARAGEALALEVPTELSESLFVFLVCSDSEIAAGTPFESLSANTEAGE